MILFFNLLGEVRTKVTLIDGQYYTGSVIIAPGQSIEEVIVFAVADSWRTYIR